LKILVISSAAIPTPPSRDDSYGGLEVIVWNFCSEAALQEQGHDITLISARGSPMAGRWKIKEKSQITVQELSEPSWHVGELDHYLGYREQMENDFGNGEGIIWDNTWQMYSYLSISGGYYDFHGRWQDTLMASDGRVIKLKPHPGMKIIHTHHGMPNASTPPPRVRYPRFVGLSTAHAQFLGSIMNIPVRTVHNGIVLPEWKSNGDEYDDRGYFLSLNRMTYEKGIHDSIDIALQTRTPIKVIGDDTKVISQQYVADIIRRCRDSNGMAEYYGLVDMETKNEALKHCKAVIACPINQGRGAWVEAYGMYAVEGLSMGKPFIGLRNGGLIDIIRPELDGFLGYSPNELVQYVPQLSTIDKQKCRERAEYFSAANMAKNYVDLFEKVMKDDESGKW
jgi:glycosyltransferase involved in cell wall biosynthesis